MIKKVLEIKAPKTVNSELKALENVQDAVKELQAQAEAVGTAISESFSDCVVIFVDLVGSTEFKLKHSEPEWVLRVKLFVDVVSKYAKELGGTVVKVIGDEVMLAFTREEQVNDALNLVMRATEIESALHKITGFPTKIKIALDGGKVCFIKYDGTTAADPQGTPVDRCARISKYCQQSTVLTSENMYLRFEHKDLWKFVGKPNIKGIGPTSVYQLGAATVKVVDEKSIPLTEYDRLIALEIENKQLVDKNRKLQDQIREAGKKPEPTATVPDGQEEALDAIKGKIFEVSKLIDGAPSSNKYAKFHFLYQISDTEKYDTFEGNTFDELIRAGLVYDENDNGYYGINPNNKRNQAVLEKLSELEILLDNYKEHFGDIDQEDMFEHSVKDPDFWTEYMGYQVQ